VAGEAVLPPAVRLQIRLTQARKLPALRDVCMKIVVDGFNLALEKGTGVATYGRNLTYCLHDMGHEVDLLYGKAAAPGKTSLMQEVAFFDSGADASISRFSRIARGIRNGVRVRSPDVRQVVLSGAVIYNQFFSSMPYFDNLWNCPRIFDYGELRFRLYGSVSPVRFPGQTSIMHWTYPLPLKLPGARNIYTFHDLVPLRLPYTTLDKKHSYYKLVQKLAYEADHIVTVSETSKADIISLLGVPEEKVTNTYQSVSIPEKYLSLPNDVLRDELFGTFQLEYKNYLLFYGSIEPKKNIGRIVEAYLASNLEIPLVVIGAQAWKSENEMALLKQLATAKDMTQGASKRRVLQLEYATFPQLVNLIRGALAVTFPSLYEGFGLPILESMICETPIITSNLGSMIEIAGDAGILVDPYNTRDIKEAMIAVTHNAGLREDKISRGRAVAKAHSAEVYRQRLADLYGRLTGSGQGEFSRWS
jgi:glycosyltransferase involved in cell wall biosynthesis